MTNMTKMKIAQKILGILWCTDLAVAGWLYRRFIAPRLIASDALSESCSSCRFMSFTGLRHGIGFECRKGMSGHPFDWTWGNEKCSHYEAREPTRVRQYLR